MTVGGLQPGYYVKSVRYDQGDALNQPLQFSGSESATLDVVISPNAGQLQGVVTDNRLQPAPGIQAVLVPDRTRDRTELYRTSTTDQNGRFTIANIPPGEYKIFAWEAIEQFAYFDPELLKRFESQGKPVHVTESSRETVDVKMIPAGQ